MDYEFKDSYNGLHSDFTDSSNTYKLLKWSTFSNSWDNFTEKYKTFHFDKSLNDFSVRLADDTNSIANLETPINTKEILQNLGAGNSNSIII